MFLHHETYRVKSRYLADLARSVNALRHVTYRARDPWMAEDDLVLTKTLGERIKYVRTNLVDSDGQPMTQPAFAKAVGLAEGQHRVIGWERKGSEPRERARKAIADLTDGAYRHQVFSRGGAEVLVKEIAVPRLQRLEAQAGTSRRIVLAVLTALDEHGIRVQLDQADVESLATQGSHDQAANGGPK